MRAKIERIANHHFQFHVRQFAGDIDVLAEAQAPQDLRGPSPKELALASLCGCTGTDVIDLMAKFKITYQSFTVEARGDLTDKHPKIFTKIDLTYEVNGVEGDPAMIAEAVKRSTHQYSGMAYMLSRAVPIHYVVRANKTEIATGTVEFA